MTIYGANPSEIKNFGGSSWQRKCNAKTAVSQDRIKRQASTPKNSVTAVKLINIALVVKNNAGVAKGAKLSTPTIFAPSRK